MRPAFLQEKTWRRGIGALLAAAVMMLVGCVTVVEEVKPLASARLVVSRAGSDATLQFSSEVGITYQILYAASRKPGSTWQPLPGADRVKGNGQLIEYRDTIPYSTPRYYRLRVLEVIQKK